MIAPSILASSERRCGVNSESRRKPPEQTESTSGPSPITMSAPMRACRMRSSPSRSCVPGATRRRAYIIASVRDCAGTRRTLPEAARQRFGDVVYRDDLQDRVAVVADGGASACVKPRRAASSSRRSSCGTARISPPRPTSPTATVPPTTGCFRRALPTASASARSTPVSVTRSPPATLAYTSAFAVLTPPCWSSTASTIARRAGSMPAADRRGGRQSGTTNACTSTSNGRVPSSTTATAEPGAPARRSRRNRDDASGTSSRPWPVISNSPSS